MRYEGVVIIVPHPPLSCPPNPFTHPPEAELPSFPVEKAGQIAGRPLLTV